MFKWYLNILLYSEYWPKLYFASIVLLFYNMHFLVNQYIRRTIGIYPSRDDSQFCQWIIIIIIGRYVRKNDFAVVVLKSNLSK